MDCGKSQEIDNMSVEELRRTLKKAEHRIDILISQSNMRKSAIENLNTAMSFAMRSNDYEVDKNLEDYSTNQLVEELASRKGCKMLTVEYEKRAELIYNDYSEFISGESKIITVID